MSKVLLPAIVGERQQLESALEKLDRARDRGGWLSYFDRQLRDIDGQLSLVKATEQACEPLDYEIERIEYLLASHATRNRKREV